MPKLPAILHGRLVLPATIFAVGAMLAAGLGLLAAREVEHRAAQRFDAVALEAALKVEDRFGAYTEVLIGLRALFNTTDAVTREQFKHYVEGLNLAVNYPGFQVLNYAPRVPAAEKEAFEKRMRGDTSLDATLAARLAISPPGDRPDYHPFTLIEPLAGNERVLGKDVAADPAVLKAMALARDTGGLTTSGRKIKINGRESDIGLATRLPVYQLGMPVDTQEQRRAAYRGSVGAGFHLGEMLRDVISADARTGLRLRLYDAGTNENHSDVRAGPRATVAPATPLPHDKQMYDSKTTHGMLHALADGQDADLMQRTLAFDFGGRSWLAQISASRSVALSSLERLTPWLIFLGGVAISLLAAAVAYSLINSRRRAEALALDMTRDLRASEHQLGEAQRIASLGSWVLDLQSGQFSGSAEAGRILGAAPGASPPELGTLLARIPLEQRGVVEQELARATQSTKRIELEHRLSLPDGTERWLHVIAQASRVNGRAQLHGTVRDDTQRRQAAMRLKVQHDVARLLVSAGEPQDVIGQVLQIVCGHVGWEFASLWVADARHRARCSAAWSDGLSTHLSEFTRASENSHYSSDEGAIGRAWASGEPGLHTNSILAGEGTRERQAAQAGMAQGLVVPGLDGAQLTALELLSARERSVDADTLDSLRAITQQLAQYEQRHHAERALRYVATHDELTGLSNRSTLQNDLWRALKRNNRRHTHVAVMFVDLDRFKRINDTLGHAAGDAILKACSERLLRVLRDDDTVARFGGDEYVLVLENLTKPSDAAIVADKVLACCAEPFTYNGRELHLSASVGVSIYPEDGADAAALLKNADAALHRAKEKARGSYQFYAAHMNEQSAERLVIETALRRALERNELELHYQPKMSLSTKTIVGVEALMRWRHPELGLVSPVKFIPIAEETGLIVALGNWALQTACANAAEWQTRGLPPVVMSVNLSTRQLTSPTLLDDIRRALSNSGLAPELLELEITESAMMTNPDQAAALLQEIRNLGVGLAIDDFGTGYSSLSYLRRFPLTAVKIDRSFVNDISQDTDAQALIEAIIKLAHGLRMKVVAEGVETPEQLDYLLNHSCDEIQGYWLSKPTPAEEVCAFMARHLRQQLTAPVAA